MWGGIVIYLEQVPVLFSNSTIYNWQTKLNCYKAFNFNHIKTNFWNNYSYSLFRFKLKSWLCLMLFGFVNHDFVTPIMGWLNHFIIKTLGPQGFLKIVLITRGQLCFSSYIFPGMYVLVLHKSDKRSSLSLPSELTGNIDWWIND